MLRLKIQNMAALLVSTEEMIECFHSCVEKFQKREELKLSEAKHEGDCQKLEDESSQIKNVLKLSEEKREEDGQKLRNELMCSEPLKYQNMAVQLVLTEEMIECFHSCAKKADYRQLFSDYHRFFYVLVENLEKVHYPDNSNTQFFTKNTQFFLDILRQWHSSVPSFCKEFSDMEKFLPVFMTHFKKFGSVQNWNYFYTNYKSTADVIITRARKQDVLDFQIECKGKIFDSFCERDEFLKSYIVSNDSVNESEPQAAPRSCTVDDIKAIENKLEEDGQKLRKELMDCFASQAQQVKNQISEANEKMSQIKEELKLKEAKLEKDGQKLRDELMDRFASHAQQMENRISEMNERMEYLTRRLAHFDSSFNEKFNSLGAQFNSIQLEKKTETLSLQKNSGEDLNQFLAKIGDKLSEQQVKMELRAEWMDKKMDKMMEMMEQKKEKSSEDEK